MTDAFAAFMAARYDEAARSVSKYSVHEERFGRDYAAAERRSGEVRRTRDVDAFAR